MFDLVFFYKICFDRRRRLEVKQWCYIGSAEWADDMVDTTFFFLCLGHGRDLFIVTHFHTYLGGSCTGNTGWENLVCWLVQCNCDMLEALFSCSCYLLSLDLVAAVLVATTTK